jgi:hypothetical protein
VANAGRCPCPHERNGNRCGRNPLCPEHGDAAIDLHRYEYTDKDRRWLRESKFGDLTREELDEIEQDSNPIHEARKADEDRWRRDG